MTDRFEEAYRRWREEVLGPALAHHPQRKSDFETSSGIEHPAVHVPQLEGFDYLAQLGFPGQPPFTRGIHPSMYRTRLWTMRQYAGYASAAESNRRYRYLLDQGQSGLSVAFDLPTQIGYDADDPIAEGEVGRVGVSISSLDDMITLFDQIPLEKVSTSMTINAPAAVLLAMYIAVAKRQGVEPRDLRGTIQNDILKEYIARGTYIFPPDSALRLITDVFEYCSEHLPRWNTISVSGYHIREAGATASQELAFTLANAIAYLEAAAGAGLDVQRIAAQISFFFSSDRDFLEEVAKFRAARRMWTAIMSDRFGVSDPDSIRLRFHTQTAGSSLTAQQPENNIVRVALQALAAVLGGTQSLHTNSMDEALGLPTEDAVTLALRTQQIIAYETGAADTADPLGGSYALETLTDELEVAARQYLDQIDSIGGALKSIQTGFIQREIQDSAYRFQLAVEEGRQVIVGVNRFESGAAQPIEILRVDPSVERQQRERLGKLRQNRDQRAVDLALEKLRQAADSHENIMPTLIECVESRATLGEICGQLRELWGEYQQPALF